MRISDWSSDVCSSDRLYCRFRWPWISELYELIQSIYLLPALISEMLNPRKPTFKVTAKDETLERSYISELGGPFYIIFAVLLAGLAIGSASFRERLCHPG